MTARTTDALPIAALLALAMAAFITILTEALPAGLLPQLAHGLQVSEAWVGQTVTIYAIGSLVAAIPLTAATRGLRRRPVLLMAIAGFVAANTVTAVSSSYPLTLLARFLAGVSAGLVWALLAGYAARMVHAHQRGRAIAIAMVGTPLALSLGVPAGTFLGQLVGWRMCFASMSGLAVLLLLWARVALPDFPARRQASALRWHAWCACRACDRCCAWCWRSCWRITCSTPTSPHSLPQWGWAREPIWCCWCSA